MILTLVVVAAAMGVSDFLGTVLVVAESRGWDRCAGAMDALGDVARMVCLVAGVDAIKGFTGTALAVLVVMMLTSYHVTRRTTVWTRKLCAKHPSPPVTDAPVS